MDKRSRFVQLMIAMCMSFVVMLVLLLIIRQSEQKKLLKIRERTLNVVDARVHVLEQTMDQALSATFGVAAVVQQGEGTIDDFPGLAQTLMVYHPSISSLQLAPDGIVLEVVPLEGNEKAIGHDLLKDPKRSREAALARDSRALTLAGPVQLIQGGQAAIGRLPVFLPGDRFWGFVIVLIQFPRVLEESGISNLPKEGFDYVLWKDQPGSDQRLIIDSSISESSMRDPVERTFSVPNAEWVLSVAPLKGWISWPLLTIKIGFGLLFSLAFGWLAFHALKKPMEMKEEIGRTTRALKVSRREMDTLLKTLPDLVWLCDPEGTFLTCNNRFEDYVGVSESNLRQLGADHPDLHKIGVALRQWDRDAIKAKKPLSGAVEVTFADGHDEYLEAIVTPVFDEDGALIGTLGIGRDVTARHRAERNLVESEKKYRSVVETSSDGFFIVDETGRILEVNESYVNKSGYAREEILEMSVADLEAEESPEEMRQHIEKIRLTGGDLFESLHRNKSGELWPVEINTHILDTGQGGFCTFVRDITNRRKAEQERLDMERNMLHVQKLESLGVMAGGIAHDFNNILLAVMGHADLALLTLPDNEPIRSSLNEIIKASKRAAELCQQMLAYSGRGRFVIESMNMNDVIREMVELLRSSLSKKAQLNLNLNDQLPMLAGDATQIRQILMNLITNASEALNDRTGIVNITTGVVSCDEDELNRYDCAPTTRAGEYVFIDVQDNGCGMDEETVNRIFEPFFTTKFTGRGLGMAAVMGIVRGHHGAIHVDSKLDVGSTFRILLPVSKDGLLRIPKEHPVTRMNARKRACVLLVDDEHAVRSIASKMLESLGFRVLLAMDGKHGLDVYDHHHDQIDLVLLDATMPRMDGFEAFRLLRQRNAQVPIVLSSGYSKQDVVARLAVENLDGFIHKPYSLDGLSELLKGLFNDRPFSGGAGDNASKSHPS